MRVTEKVVGTIVNHGDKAVSQLSIPRRRDGLDGTGRVDRHDTAARGDDSWRTAGRRTSRR